MGIEIQKPTLLIVEGRDEEVFFEALVRNLGLDGVQAMPIGGKTKLRENLAALVRSPRFAEVASLGIVRDADDRPESAFQSVHDALQATGLPAPTGPMVPAGASPRVMVVILPAHNVAGMLEDLCLDAVSQDPAMQCVDQYFECLAQQDIPSPHNIPKARVQVFLASRAEAGKRLGEAAQAGYWPWDTEAFDSVKSFIEQIAS